MVLAGPYKRPPAETSVVVLHSGPAGGHPTGPIAHTRSVGGRWRVKRSAAFSTCSAALTNKIYENGASDDLDVAADSGAVSFAGRSGRRVPGGGRRPRGGRVW